MNQAYENMRLFWHNVNNFDTKKQINEYGPDKIVVAGIEFSMCDHNGKLKNILLAANALGDCSLYFENNSPLGFGALIGQHNKKLDNTISSLLTEASNITNNMKHCPEIPPPPEMGLITFFALGEGGNFYKTLPSQEVRTEKHPYFPFYAYTQQIISILRAEEDKKVNK